VQLSAVVASLPAKRAARLRSRHRRRDPMRDRTHGVRAVRTSARFAYRRARARCRAGRRSACRGEAAAAIIDTSRLLTSMQTGGGGDRAAGLPASWPLAHKSEVPSQKCFTEPPCSPERVGLPRGDPTLLPGRAVRSTADPRGNGARHSRRGSHPRYRAHRALAPPISSMPRAILSHLAAPAPRGYQ